MTSYTAIAVGPLGLLFAVLGLLVSRARIGRQASGDRFDRLRRAHGNAAEHIPILVILLFIAELLGAPRPLLLGAAIAMIGARVIHPVGYVIRQGHPLQFTGATITYILEAGLAILVIVMTIRD